ncbi:UNVERIFIED_CONTAM: hypothetical protein Sradi_3818800 [Sesamum radiatum]|uniref:CCHC-type domain-containing protein n=1 Tax=Sesamum radiatum TaxID=300843 RepID=A0AAW2Q0Y9_SESRA
MGTQQQSRANDICAHCREKGHWKRDCPKLPPSKVLQRSRKLSKDEVVLRLGNGKAVVVEAVGTVNLVISDHVRLELKDCYFVPSMIKSIISILLLDNGLCLPDKFEAFVRFKEFRLEVENQTGRKVKILRSNRGGEYLSGEFLDYPKENVAQTAYQIWHGKPASYKYLRVWGSPAYVKRLVGDKLDSLVLVYAGTSSTPIASTDNVSVLCRSARVPQPPERYGFLGMTGQLDNDPKTYGEAMSDIDLGKWLEAMKFKMDSMSSNQVWTLVDRPKGVKSVGSMAKPIQIMLAIVAWNDYEICLEKVQDGTLQRGFLSVRHGVKLSKKQFSKTDEELKRMLDVLYASTVGSIQYIAQCTGPDVAYALSVTNRYQACAWEAHWTAVKTILKYLKRTKDMFLVYGSGELILEGYSNASFHSNEDDAKLQSGFVFKFNGGVVASKSSKQDNIADSAMEVEYIVASEAAKEAV